MAALVLIATQDCEETGSVTGSVSEEEFEQDSSSHTGIRKVVLISIGVLGLIGVSYAAVAAVMSHAVFPRMTHKLVTDSHGNEELRELDARQPNLRVKMASVNFQTPEVPNWDARVAIFKAHLSKFFAGVEIFAMQETKQFYKGGYKYGGDLVVKDIQQKILGEKWGFIIPTEAFSDMSADAQNSDCDVSLFYDSSNLQLVASGSRRTGADQFDPRSVVWGVFRRPQTNTLFAVFNTHGPIGSIIYGYNSQFEAMRRAVDEVKAQFPDVHIIVVGDFNRVYQDDWNFGHGIQMVKATNGRGGNFDFDWVFSSLYKSGQVTYGNLKHESGVCSGADCSTETGSDHKAVLIEMEFESSMHTGIAPQIV